MTTKKRVDYSKLLSYIDSNPKFYNRAEFYRDILTTAMFSYYIHNNIRMKEEIINKFVKKWNLTDNQKKQFFLRKTVVKKANNE